MKCSRCPENHPACLDFHHICGNKTKNVAKMVTEKLSMKTIMQEIAKCIVLCSNCHRKEHSVYENRLEARTALSKRAYGGSSPSSHANLMEISHSGLLRSPV